MSQQQLEALGYTVEPIALTHESEDGSVSTIAEYLRVDGHGVTGANLYPDDIEGFIAAHNDRAAQAADVA